MSAYRTPALVPVSTHVPARERCPECGRDIRWIDTPVHCHYTIAEYQACQTLHCNKVEKRVTAGIYCGPNQRLRFGFLWLRRCREPGTHIHQSCERCGWRGVSHPPEAR